MLPVTEGLLIAVLGTHLVLLVFVVWQIAQCLRRESDPFVGHALSCATCELYHRYGMFLAPLTAALTTLKHCQFGYCCPVRVHDGGDEAGEPIGGGGASTESSGGKSYEES